MSDPGPVIGSEVCVVWREDPTDPGSMVPVDVFTGARVVGKCFRLATESVDGDSDHPNQGKGPTVVDDGGTKRRLRFDASGNPYGEEAT